MLCNMIMHLNRVTSAHSICLECLLVTFASKNICFCEYSSMMNSYLTFTKKTRAQTVKNHCFLRDETVNHRLAISKQCNVITLDWRCVLSWLTIQTPYLHHIRQSFLPRITMQSTFHMGESAFAFLVEFADESEKFSSTRPSSLLPVINSAVFHKKKMAYLA